MKTLLLALIVAGMTSTNALANADLLIPAEDAALLVQALVQIDTDVAQVELPLMSTLAADAFLPVGERRYQATVLGVAETDADRVLRFHVAGASRDSLVTMTGGLAAGEISTPDGAFYLHPTSSGHVLEAVRELPCVVAVRHTATVAAEDRAGSRRRRTVRHSSPGDVAEIGFLATYTSRFEKDRGGEAGVLLEFRNAVQALNEGLRATGAAKTVVLLRGALRVDDSYLEVRSASSALAKLWADKDFQRARFEAKAGVVMHFDIIAEGGGRAYTLDYPEHPWSGNGLAVVDWRTGFSVPRTVQHEFGHAAFGLHHDRAYAPANACPYCLAWGSCEAGLKDRMGSVSCWAEELPGYSGLSRYERGVRIGSEESDALRRILETRFVAAGLWQYALQDLPTP